MRLLATFCLFISTGSLAQIITGVQQKALNNFIDYANHSAEEVSAVAKHIIEYYPSIENAKRRTSTFNSNYTCNVQPEDFYFSNALAGCQSLNAFPALNVKLKSLRAVAEKIDQKCKALDTYYKLEDYKQDNFGKAEALVNAFPDLLKEYKQSQRVLMVELELVYKKLNTYVPTNAYRKTDLFMREQIKTAQALIDSWTLNLKQDIHTGWPVEKLELSISKTDEQLKIFEAESSTLKYPASSMVSSFKGSMISILETERSALDGYNFEAKKSDQYSNEVYLDLINYFNGALVADYNAFIDYSAGDNYFGLKAVTCIPIFEIRTKEEQNAVVLEPFQDIARSPLVLTPQRISISKLSFDALNNYVDLINELLRQSAYLQLVIRNLNADAMYYKDLTNYKGKGGLNFDYENFQMPLSLYQKTIDDSKSVPMPARQSLNDQATVLRNVLKEMDELSASFETETRERLYEKDNLKKIYQLLDRSRTLFEILDARKEQLYDDVRGVFESYAISNGDNSWRISGKALQKLADFDHEGLFAAKAYYKNNSGASVSTAKIDETLREVITNEYANMKGIEKIGRNNGLYPYTPYEDLPQSSKILSEKLGKLKPATQSGYEHPYHEMVYHYNDVVDDFNKFSELSKEVFLLKIIKQPELFFVCYPVKRQEDREPSGELAVKPVESEQPRKPDDQTITDIKPSVKTKVVHDTVTVYIEKRDTIYMGKDDVGLHSMDGYATNNMILLLDVSGSMNSPEKLPLLKKSILDLLTMMRPEDEVSIIVYSGKAKVLLAPTSFKEEDKIRKVIEKLKSEGKTDGNAGLRLAYKVADENYVRGGNNRIILATDGEFPINDEIFKLVEGFSKEDIFISVFNFGKSNTSSKNLERLSSAGKGNYEYITKENVEMKLIGEVKSKRKK